MANNNEVRLQKFMAEQGVASRRKSEDLIRAGKVKVNGHIAEIGMKINPRKDLVTVGKQKLTNVKNRKMVYIMLNKPRGYVTTVSDELGRKTVMDLLPDFGCRIYPVGRLDKDSEGLLILTNDGALANAVMHPSRHIKKRYRVTVRGEVTDDKLTTLASGVKIDTGITLPCTVAVLAEEENRTVLEFTIAEGKNRQIRKMCEAVKLQIVRLKRNAVGNIKLGMLKPGEWADLTAEELKGLKALVSSDKSTKRTGKK